MKLRFTYFKRSGKYYTTGDCELRGVTCAYEASKSVRSMLEFGAYPGLASGGHKREFHVLVTGAEQAPFVPMLFPLEAP